MHELQIFINDEEVVCKKEFTINEELLSTSSVILENCYPKAWENDKDYVSRFYYPEDYSKCRILRNGELIFCGVVKNSGEISLNPRYPHFCKLQILDFKTLLSEGETLDFVITNKSVNEAIDEVISAVSKYGFIKGNINIFHGDDIIGAYSTQNMTAYDVFQYLSDITGSKWFTRLVNENQVAIDFYDPTLMERGINLDYTNDFFKKYAVQDLSFSYGSRDYRNKQIMTSEQVFGSIEYKESLISNGYSKRYDTQEKIGIINSMSVDGKEASFATNSMKDIGVVADFYYTAGNSYFESDDDTYIAGTRINITYTPIVNGRQVVLNNDEVDRVATSTGRKGTIARYENRNDVTSNYELDMIGQTYIRYKGSAEVNLTLITKDKDIYKVGDVVYFNSPIKELSQEYMVKRKETKVINIKYEEFIWYTYTLTSSFNGETAINWFDNQRRKAKGNIGEGQTITRNIDIESDVNIIFNNLLVKEVEIKNTNALDTTLDSPLVV